MPGPFLGDTWVFNGKVWSQVGVSGPSARFGAQMAYDPVTGLTYLFGGYLANGTSAGDTWAWNGATWSLLAPASAPPGRYGGVMAYDGALGAVVLFGGVNTSSGVLGDTWFFNGYSWVQVASGGPSPRLYAAMAPDSSVGSATSGGLILFGGQDRTGIVGDTWVYRPSGWTQLAPAHYPGSRLAEGLAFDAVLDRVVFFGGADSSNVYGDTWMWDGADWEVASSVPAPSYREAMVMLPAAGNGQLSVFGGAGVGGGTLADTYIYDWEHTGGAPGATIESYTTSARSSSG